MGTSSRYYLLLDGIIQASTAADPTFRTLPHLPSTAQSLTASPVHKISSRLEVQEAILWRKMDRGAKINQMAMGRRMSRGGTVHGGRILMRNDWGRVCQLDCSEIMQAQRISATGRATQVSHSIIMTRIERLPKLDPRPSLPYTD